MAWPYVLTALLAGAAGWVAHAYEVDTARPERLEERLRRERARWHRQLTDPPSHVRLYREGDGGS